MTDRTSPEQIQTWLVERVAGYLECPAAVIDPDSSLADYGLDSLDKFTLCCDIEDTFDTIIEPIVLWDVPTLRALTPHILCRTNTP